MRSTLAIIVGAAIVLLALAPARSEAVMFCNMDGAGGAEARRIQERSARTAAVFLQAAATTFQMLSHVEMHLAGDPRALGLAAELGTQGLKQLDQAAAEFKAMAQDSNALRAVNNHLKANANYSAAFQQARVGSGTAVAQLVLEARQKSAEHLVQVCADTALQLQSRETPMGKTFAQVRQREVPAAADLWAALAQWNEALARGRLVAAMFGTINK